MSAFNFERVRINWFPSHMRRALDKMERILHRVDVVVEVRDARIPISSSNARFEELLSRKQRILVFNKRDLAEEATNKRLGEVAKDIPFIVSNGLSEGTTAALLKTFRETLRDDDRILVVGIPNVGKSTLINGLRHKGVECTKGRAVRVGRLAGVTKNVSEIVRILDKPKVYAYDSPGIMLPSRSDIVELVRIAATGGVNDHAVLKDDLVHYLYHTLNARGNRRYLDHYGFDRIPDGGINGFAESMCKKFNYVTEKGRLNLEIMHVRFLRDFRLGNFGRITLDEF